MASSAKEHGRPDEVLVLVQIFSMPSPQNPKKFGEKARIASAEADFLKNPETRAQPRQSRLFSDVLPIFSMPSPQNPHESQIPLTVIITKIRVLVLISTSTVRVWPAPLRSTGAQTRYITCSDLEKNVENY